MKKTKEEIEVYLENLLYDLLSGGRQEDEIHNFYSQLV